MAKYAQGYARKNSDTKNLIIMISVIVAVILIAIMFVIFYNKFWKTVSPSLSDDDYSSYYLSSYTALLDQDKKNGGNYMLYVCTTDSSTTDSNEQAVIKYIKEYEAGTATMKIYLIDYSKFDSTSDSTETSNASSIKTELGFAPQLGYLIYVYDNRIINKATELLTSSDNVKNALVSVAKNGTWPYEVK